MEFPFSWCGRQVSALWAGRRRSPVSRFAFFFFVVRSSREPAIICTFAQLSTTKRKRDAPLDISLSWCGRQELKTPIHLKSPLFSRHSSTERQKFLIILFRVKPLTFDRFFTLIIGRISHRYYRPNFLSSLIIYKKFQLMILLLLLPK